MLIRLSWCAPAIRRCRAADNRRLWLGPMLVALLLAACSGPPSPQPPLPDLHLPGVTKIPGLANVPTKPTPGHYISLTTYPAAKGANEPRVLFVVDGALYDVGLDGSELQQIPLDVSCGDISATVDGRWAACQGEGYGGILQVISLTANPPADVRQITFDDTGSVARAVLSPAGHYLTAVSTLGGGCSIAIYAASAMLDSFRLRVVLSLPQFTAPGPPSACLVSGLSWSPNEVWLAFEGESRTRDIYVLPIASLVSNIDQTDAAPGTLAITPTMLTRLGRTGSTAPPAWSLFSGALAVTFVGGDGLSFVRVDLATHKQTTLLTVNDGELLAIAWTADSGHFVFSIHVPWCGDCGATPGPQFKLYVYTPPA
jgi:hypothetical protein